MNTKEEMKNNIGIYSLRQANGHIIKKIKKIEKCRLSCLQLTLIIISTIILLGAIIATIIVIVNKRKKDEKESNNNIIIENNEQKKIIKIIVEMTKMMKMTQIERIMKKIIMEKTAKLMMIIRNIL